MMFFDCISVAIVAFVFFAVLTAPGMVFEFWYNYLERLNSRAPWIAKPLGFCGVCFSGQLGLWWYLISYRDEWVLGDHIIFIAQTIFFFLIIKSWANKNELV